MTNLHFLQFLVDLRLEGHVFVVDLLYEVHCASLQTDFVNL